MRRQRSVAVAVVGLITSISLYATAGEVPPKDGLALSVVIRMLEEQKVGIITDVEFDDGFWEVKVQTDTSWQKLYIDPHSGKETRRSISDDPDDTPPANAKALSEIVKQIEAGEIGAITEVEFDNGAWEVEIRSGGRTSKQRIDPVTGEPAS
jgi:hypothetical protein